MNPGRRRAAAVIAIIVVCSALAGAAIERTIYQGHRGPRGAGGAGGPGGPGRGSHMQDSTRRIDMLDRMVKDLSLTPAQRAGIDSVMRRSDSALRAIRTEMQPRLQSVLEGSRADIQARLSPDQKAKFDAMAPSRRGRRP